MSKHRKLLGRVSRDVELCAMRLAHARLTSEELEALVYRLRNRFEILRRLAVLQARPQK